MLYSCTSMATVGIKGLIFSVFYFANCHNFFCFSCLWICCILSHTLSPVFATDAFQGPYCHPPFLISHIIICCSVFICGIFMNVISLEQLRWTWHVKLVKFPLKGSRSPKLKYDQRSLFRSLNAFVHSWVFTFAWNLTFTITVIR